MSEEKPKKKPVAKKAPAKKKASPVVLNKGPKRVYGACVYVNRCSREEAARLIDEHGFRLEQDLGKEAVVHADKKAFDSYAAERMKK
tara:strand:+ start:386 stop:646 length:261 start_codon:yes stop_codon:yes gene_type:complete